MEHHHITAEHLSVGRVREILERRLPLALSDDARARIVRCREYLDRKMENPERPIYGITTGFGSLCDISVGSDELSRLQQNLVMSHACGTGERVPSEIVRLILLLKIQSLAYGVWSLIHARRLSEWADRIGALSLDAFDGRIEPFCDEVHLIRAHRGQLATARNVRGLLEGSELIARPKHHVQDPYSFRCMPQVHGASKDTIDYVESVLTTEINSTTDNPTVFPEEDMVVSAGNFHGQPIALAMDFLAIALAELGNISERRTYKLISGARELPKFLVANPGLNSGFMIPQYTAASIVSQSKGLCMPASVDSIPSSQGQEDHVSMGSNAATKLWRVVCNTERVLAIELFNAAQAIEFRRPAHTSPELERMLADYRKEVPFIDNDEVMYPHIEASVRFLRGL